MSVRTNSIWPKLGSTAVVLVVVWFVVNFFSVVGSSMSHAGYTPTWQDYSAEFGLKHNKEYPLVMGRTIAGSSGDITVIARRGYFTAASTSINPDQALTMGFRHGDKSYIVSLPFSKTTFIPREGVDPTVKIKISNQQISPGGHSNLINTETHMVCPMIVVCYMTFLPGQSQTAADTPAWPAIQEESLGSFLSEHLVAVEVTLSPKLYEELLGSTEPQPSEPTNN